VTLTEVENLLSVRLGFDVHTIGRHAVAAVIGQSMEESGCSDPASYARLLTTDPNAWDSLVDKVIVPETWFFRDTEPFNLISDRARAQMLRPTGGMFRILSCPCSTGEEAFSLAIAMLHAGARSESFTVDAVDVSKAALESAQAAVFRARSFRENDLIYHIPYFAPPDLSGLWRLNRDVAAMVRFRQGNLIAPDFLLEEAPYDLVLCRNLLIYLHSEARLLAIKALRRLVADDGVLVLGHAEAAFARDHGFKPVGHAAAFAFIKPSDSVIPKAQPAIRANPSSLARPQSPLVETIGAPALPGEPSTDVARPRPEADHSRLALARQLGDAGRLHEALQICSEYLKSAPASADGHFLLGVLHDALGHPDLAVSYFGKALYLDPSHRDALLHLALKREAAGDRASAALLRTRAHRTPEVSTAE
jgi:chemotaxis protein methyltransferase WspC